MVSETEPELAALIETDDSMRPKREKSVETDVPCPAEIVQKFETLEGTDRQSSAEESSSDRRKRIRMMLLNSLAGETVTGLVEIGRLENSTWDFMSHSKFQPILQTKSKSKLSKKN